MKTTENNYQNKRDVKKAININWNSRLFFQIGVIVSLLLVFFLMQTDFEMRVAEYKPDTSHGLEEPPMMNYEIDLDIPKPVEKQNIVVQKKMPIQRVIQSNTFEVKPNTAPDIESPIATTNVQVNEAPVTPVNTTVTPADNKPKNIMNVEFVPVFPGCESLGTNAEKVECMSSKISSFVNKKFRKEVLENLKPNETYRIYVNFKIDSKGFVTEVVANAHNENLKKEAQRVIGDLPTMKPGKQGDKNVDVLYTVPIAFKIQ